MPGKVSTDRLTKGASVSRNVRIKISVSKTNKNDSALCTQTCPYRLAKLGTSLRIRGKLTLRKKAIKFYKSINWSNEYTKNRIGNVSCPRLSGKVSTGRLTKGVRVSRHVKRFLTKQY